MSGWIPFRRYRDRVKNCASGCWESGGINCLKPVVSDESACHSRGSGSLGKENLDSRVYGNDAQTKPIEAQRKKNGTTKLAKDLARQSRNQKNLKVPLLYLPRRGGEQRGGSAPLRIMFRRAT